MMSCNSSSPPPYCPSASLELKLHQAFIYSGPVFFAFVLVLVFFLLYLRWRRTNWQSIQMRAIQLSRGESPRPAETGIKKEVREMLPVVVFKESFLIRETQCSVCLGDYQSDERLRKIPPCGHTFHVDCIDHWLASNTTCPLCRISLLPATKTATNAVSYEGRDIGEGSEELSAEGESSGRIIPQEEGNVTDEHLEHSRREEESKHQEEGYVIIDVETHSNVEGGH